MHADTYQSHPQYKGDFDLVGFSRTLSKRGNFDLGGLCPRNYVRSARGSRSVTAIHLSFELLAAITMLVDGGLKTVH